MVQSETAKKPQGVAGHAQNASFVPVLKTFLSLRLVVLSSSVAQTWMDLLKSRTMTIRLSQVRSAGSVAASLAMEDACFKQTILLIHQY
ncbi:MAG: hypothetical protein AAF591_23705 [Verrucomicrobiota bacterium]